MVELVLVAVDEESQDEEVLEARFLRRTRPELTMMWTPDAAEEEDWLAEALAEVTAGGAGDLDLVRGRRFTTTGIGRSRARGEGWRRDFPAAAAVATKELAYCIIPPTV